MAAETFWERVLDEIVGQGLFESGKAGLRALIGTFAEQTGTKLGTKTADWMVNKLFKEAAEERRIEQAQRKLPPNEWTRLTDRLKVLPDGLYEWWIFLMLDESLDVMAATMLAHARLDDPDWGNQRAIMERDCRLAEEQSKQFFEWLKARGSKVAAVHSAARAQVTSHPTFAALKKLRGITGKWADDQSW